MRVILNLLPSTAERIAGTLVTEWPGAPMPFDGWLELMRLLETVGSDPSSSPDFTSKSDSCGPWPTTPEIAGIEPGSQRGES
jgi:hypothetical protein